MQMQEHRPSVAEPRASDWLQVIEQLGLGKVAHGFIGDAWVRGLSGGERRRVSIAAELLTAPGLLFCDEATTGGRLPFSGLFIRAQAGLEVHQWAYCCVACTI